MYEYNAKLVRVIDGDTVQLDIDLGLCVHRIETVRIAGVDTPELSSSDALIRAKAKAAKSFVEGQLAGSMLVVRTEKPYPTDKYGRYLALIQYRLNTNDEWRDLTAWLISEGLGVPYSGGAK